MVGERTRRRKAIAAKRKKKKMVPVIKPIRSFMRRGNASLSLDFEDLAAKKQKRIWNLQFGICRMMISCISMAWKNPL